MVHLKYSIIKYEFKSVASNIWLCATVIFSGYPHIRSFPLRYNLKWINRAESPWNRTDPSASPFPQVSLRLPVCNGRTGSLHPGADSGSGALNFPIQGAGPIAHPAHSGPGSSPWLRPNRQQNRSCERATHGQHLQEVQAPAVHSWACSARHICLRQRKLPVNGQCPSSDQAALHQSRGTRALNTAFTRLNTVVPPTGSTESVLYF